MEIANGILPAWKPVGPTTYDIIRIFKREAGFRGKVGHAGTLDPFASGVVLLLLGDATKKFDEIQKWTKTYVAEARLGYRSTTLDSEGEITPAPFSGTITKADAERAMQAFVGVHMQKVPAFSAAKHEGKPLYKHAREGKLIEKEKEVKVECIALIDFESPKAVFEAEVHSGTYIRQLSYDIFRTLGAESYLVSLERTLVGEFDMKSCVTTDDMTGDGWEELVR